MDELRDMIYGAIVFVIILSVGAIIWLKYLGEL